MVYRDYPLREHTVGTFKYIHTVEKQLKSSLEHLKTLKGNPDPINDHS